MGEIHAYFTNDGSVGLFNPEVQDIYHSTYGALREGYEKFILPANLDEYFKTHNEIKVLDICYGIGYNTKSLLNYLFENNYLKFSNNFSNFPQKNLCAKYSIDTIGSNNNTKIKYDSSIYSDNILQSNDKMNYSELIDDNNILQSKCNCNTHPNNVSIHSNNFCNNECSKGCNEEEKLPKIYIKALDTDETLFYLSPFIRQGSYSDKKKYNKKLNFRYPKVTKLLNEKFEAKYILKNEVNLLLFKLLLQNFPNYFNNITVLRLLESERFEHFIDQNIKTLYMSLRYHLGDCSLFYKIITFLHNIYYRYISKSYKKALNIPILNDLVFDPVIGDARDSIKEDGTLYNFIFLDAFTPAKCPSLWSLEFFKLLFAHLEDDGIILTYSNSAAVRNAMLHAGFFVGKIFNNETNKFTGTIAVKDRSLIKFELSEYDLGLINSKAGIFYRDENLNASNYEISVIHNYEFQHSDKISSSRFIKNYRSEHEV